MSNFAARFYARAVPGHPTYWPGVLTFSPDDLVHALFTTGRAPGDRVAHGSESVWEFVSRYAMAKAYIRQLPVSGRLSRTALATSLDRSEKVGLSYVLGQAATSLFCSTKLGVSHLLHVDRYWSTNRVVFGATRRRADLFGLSPAGWVVAEAKGRSNRVETGLSTILKAQKASIRTINGAPPAVALGCVSSFPPPEAVMRVDAWDPDPDEPTSIALDVSLDEYYLAYYLPFATAMRLGTETDSSELERSRLDGESDALPYTVRTIPGLGLTIGLPTELLEKIENASPRQPAGLADAVEQLLPLALQVGSRADGSVLRTDWADQLTTAQSTDEPTA